MKTTLKIFAILTIATVVFAQNLPNRGPIGFEAYDANKDNKISEMEFDTIKNQRMTEKYNQGYPMRNAANSPTFQDMDANNDGKITQTEMTTFQQQRFNQRMNQKMKQRGQKGFMQKGMPIQNNGTNQ